MSPEQSRHVVAMAWVTGILVLGVLHLIVLLVGLVRIGTWLL
jgi:hypothetical protein